MRLGPQDLLDHKAYKVMLDQQGPRVALEILALVDPRDPREQLEQADQLGQLVVQVRVDRQDLLGRLQLL